MAATDLESSRSPLCAPIAGAAPPAPRRRTSLLSAAVAVAVAALLAVAALALGIAGSGVEPDPARAPLSVSDSGEEGDYPFTERMLRWQHTAFHFQPPRYFMSDPSGPLYYKGWYHIFYQHNPYAAFWGNMSWGHAASKDLINWMHLPVAVAPNSPYDKEGDWTGSVAVLPDGRVVMLFTGGTIQDYRRGDRLQEVQQVVNLAFAADPSDPLLKRWVKYERNPVLVPPYSIGDKDFRDPNPVWYNSTESLWYVVVGSKNDSLSHTGIALVYTTKDFLSYTLLPGVLHSVDIVGMWECVDFFPIASGGPHLRRALSNSVPAGENVKHVLKAGLNDVWRDHYAIGTYDKEANKWTPDDPIIDVGIGHRLDWGKFYASRTLYDPKKERRVLWGFVEDVCSREVNIRKNWSSVEALPRALLFDEKSGNHLLSWPVEEVESLRTKSHHFNDIVIGTGTTIPLDVGDANQLDIVAKFEIKRDELDSIIEADVTYNCSTSDGAAARGALGPFGLLVLANQDLTEQAAIYFYIARGIDGSLQTHMCQDELRSSKAHNIRKTVVGHTVPVFDDEMMSLRILVDHSIVESYAQGGRIVATSRVYPTEAIYEGARVFLFNNATSATVIARSVKLWHMQSTNNTMNNYPGLEVEPATTDLSFASDS